MKLLLENWREFLKEGIDPRIQKQIDNLFALPEVDQNPEWAKSLPTNVAVAIDQQGRGNISVFYCLIYKESGKLVRRLIDGDSTKYILDYEPRLDVNLLLRVRVISLIHS